MILKNFSRLWDSHEVRNKVLVTIGLVLLYKFLTLIPVPGVNIE
jgi:preprotein translocase subunit SecY